MITVGLHARDLLASMLGRIDRCQEGRESNHEVTANALAWPTGFGGRSCSCFASDGSCLPAKANTDEMVPVVLWAPTGDRQCTDPMHLNQVLSSVADHKSSQDPTGDRG